MRIRDWLATAGLSTVGVALIAVGLIGMFLPVIPGLIPIAAGMTLLARRFQWADRMVTGVKHRLPSIGVKYGQGPTAIDGRKVSAAGDLDASTAA